MAFQAPLHLQRRRLKHDRHLIDSTVTGRTTDAFVHVNAVIEVSVVRQVVNSDPFDWLAGTKTRADGLEIRTVGPDLLMTAHAGIGGRHTRRGCDLNGGVAITAIDAIITDVMLVTELDRLLSLDGLSRNPGRTVDFSGHPKRCQQNKDGTKDGRASQCIGAVVKDLWHGRSPRI